MYVSFKNDPKWKKYICNAYIIVKTMSQILYNITFCGLNLNGKFQI